MNVGQKNQKRTVLDRILRFDPNAPIQRSSFFDIVFEDEHCYHCIIGFRDQTSGQFTYALLKKSDVQIENGLVLAKEEGFYKEKYLNEEEALMMGIILESTLYNGAKIVAEDLVEKGTLKDKYKISLVKNKQLVVNGYHYAFIASSFALLHMFDGYDEYSSGSDIIDLNSGGIF